MIISTDKSESEGDLQKVRVNNWRVEKQKFNHRAMFEEQEPGSGRPKDKKLKNCLLRPIIYNYFCEIDYTIFVFVQS